MIEVPATHYDDRDIRYKTKSVESVDVSDHAYTFEGLSRNLFKNTRDPPSNVTLQQMIQQTLEEYIKQITHASSSSSSSSTAVNDNDDSSDDDSAVLLKSTRKESKLTSSYKPPDKIKEHAKAVKKSVVAASSIKQETVVKRELPTIDDSVMSLFDESTRATLRITSMDRRLTHEQASREKQNIIANLNSFDGVDNDKSCMWLVSYCSAIHSVNLPPALAIQVLTQKLKGEAADWLRSMMVGVDDLSSRDVLTKVLLDFIEHYLGASKTEDFRRRLNAMKLQGKTSISDLKQFNKHFMLLKNNLAMCDHGMKESAFVTLYNQALTPEIRGYIGSDWKNKPTVDSLARAAEEAVDANTIRSFTYGKIKVENNNQQIQPSVTTKKQSDNKQMIPANPIGAAGANPKAGAPAKKTFNSRYNNTDSANDAEVTCFHCGVKGHRVTNCYLALNKQPQTTKGRAAFATYQKDIGELKAYDVDKFFEVQQRRDEWRQRNRDRRSRSRSRPQAAGTDSDGEEEEQRQLVEVETMYLRKEIPVNNMLYSSEEYDKELNSMLELEKQVGMPLGVKVNVAGVDAGMGLVDPGAVRVLMTVTLFDKLKLNKAVRVHPLYNHWLVSSSNHEVPIIGRFKAHITAQDKHLGYNLVYVVKDDKKGVRMACDLVLGRTVLASNYPYMDLRTGDLSNGDGDKIYTRPVSLYSNNKINTPAHSQTMTNNNRS
jgi:hypothetical protein